MTDWHNLLTTALVGTGRQAPRLPAAGTPLGDALAGLEDRPAEAALLGAAVALALYRRAGECLATTAQPLPEGAEAESQAVCRGRAALGWETSPRAARELLLQQLRSTDPARAREQLAQTWETEGADERAAFLATFRTGLSLDDEPFLESALDDRSKVVRRTAADL